VLAVAGLIGPVPVASKNARAQDRFPYSIMAPEPGTAKARARRAHPLAPKLWSEQKPRKQRTRRIGPSGPLPLLPSQSVVRPPPITQDRVIAAPPLRQAAPSSAPVPGYSNLPAPPKSLSGQAFPDKATGCMHYGASAGVGPDQIGAYTRACVNTR